MTYNPYLTFYEEQSTRVSKILFSQFDLNKYPLIQDDGDVYQLEKNTFIGKLDVKNNFAFLLQKEKDLYLDIEAINDAMHQDIVLVKMDTYGNLKVVEIVKRALNHLIVTTKIKKNKRLKLISTEIKDKRIALEGVYDYLVDGHVLLLDVTKITKDTIFTSLNKVVGHTNQPDIETLKIVALHGWSTQFNEDIYQTLDAIDVDFEKEKARRLDLTEIFTVTIDGADAKDLDDAISLYEKDGFYHVGIHIADVSFYVKNHDPIDQEAYKRGTSLYLADRVIPMLPHKLSNDLCSLNPDEEKLTLSACIKLTQTGEIVDYDIRESVIKTNYRLTYDRVNDLLEKNVLFEDSNLNTMLFKFESLAQHLEKIRRQRGALNFDSKEIKFIVDEEGKPINVEKRVTKTAEKLIESMMLLANEVVAKHTRLLEIPSIYRIHEKPDLDKMTEAYQTLQKLGFKAINKNVTSSKTLQAILDQSSDSPLAFIAHMILLRSMKKAKYFQEPLGHFGLGAFDYTHFTSPIRRYSDLYLHRILRALIFQKNIAYEKEYQYFSNQVESVSYQASITEKEALTIEREVNQLKSCEYMEDKIGEVFDGTITSMMKSGMFVELDNGIEGFLSLKAFNQFLVYDENRLAYISESGTYMLGQKIKVILSQVNMIDYQIDFKIYEKQKRKYKW